MTADEIEMHLQIRDVLARYCHGVDHGDLEMAQGVYWPEAEDHHGDHWDGNGQKYMRDLIGRFEQAHPAGSGRVGAIHHLHNVLICADGPDEARVEACFTAYVPHAEADRGSCLALIAGRFLDRFQRRGSEWRILDRTVVNDFTRSDVGGDIYPPGSWQRGGYLAGGFGPDDPGSAFLAGAGAAPTTIGGQG